MKSLVPGLVLLVLLASCAASPELRPAPPPGHAQLANPASTHCILSGGSLMIRKNPVGEYGICAFRGDRQCEEWALFRGKCPAGGVSVHGIPDEAGRYCVITGGRYLPGAENAKPRCVFEGKGACEVEDLFSGKCQPEQGK